MSCPPCLNASQEVSQGIESLSQSYDFFFMILKRVNFLANSAPSPGVEEEIGSSKIREETKLNMKKKNLKYSLFLDNLTYFPCFHASYDILANLRTRYSKVSALRAK